MSRSISHRAEDVLGAVARCQRYLGLLDERQGDPDLIAMAQDAIERNLQIIGEAVNHLPESVTAAHPEIPWPQIRGFRNILVHQYFGVDIDIVRDVVQNHLPPLVNVLRPYCEGEAGG